MGGVKMLKEIKCDEKNDSVKHDEGGLRESGGKYC